MSSRVVRYDTFLSASSRLRQPSAIRALQPLLSIPGMISLGGGMPNPETFPIFGLNFDVKDAISDKLHQIKLTNQQLTQALQYSGTAGLPQLVKSLEHLIERYHSPPAIEVGRSLCVTNGSQEALSRAFEMLLNPGDSVLMEDPSYSGALAIVNPLQVNHVTIDTDQDGLIPEKLSQTLDSWDISKAPKPRVLYTIPNGGNPSGASLSFPRRKAIYEIARHHDLLILEDDPYYFLQFGKKLPSLSSLDIDGRVLRFDSFSKVISSGMRLGFVSGPKPLVDRIILHGQASSLHPCGISQAILSSLMEHWGDEGFDQHISRVCNFYEGQRDAMLSALEKHMSGLAKWNKDIKAGMFVWIELNVKDSKDLIEKHAVKEKVILLPGGVFRPPNSPPSSFVRAAYSTASPENMNEAMIRLAKLVRTQLEHSSEQESDHHQEEQQQQVSY